MLSLCCEFWVGVKLNVAAFVTAEGPNGNTLITGCFRVPPKRLLGLTFVPALDQCMLMRVIRHKALDHFTAALGALHLCHCHIAGKVLPGQF